MGFIVWEPEERGLFGFFSRFSDLLQCGFSLSVWLVRNEENEVLDLEFFVVWELWEMHAAERIRALVWDFEF